jgi:hypothetical protein
VWATTRAVDRRGDHASPAGLDGRRHPWCTLGAWAHADTPRDDAALDGSTTDHATRLLLRHAPAVSKLAKSRMALS